MASLTHRLTSLALTPQTQLTPLEQRFEAQPWAPRYPAPISETYGDARFAELARDTVPLRDALGEDEGIWFGAMAYSGEPLRDIRYTGSRHLLTVAPTESGKGACAIIPNLLMQPYLSIICIDPKGQNAAVTARARRNDGDGNVYILNPFNEHGLGTSRFNPLAGMHIDSPNITADVASLAEALIVDEGKEPFFTDAARDLVKTIILHLIATEGSAATLPQMQQRLTLPSGTGKDDKFGAFIFEMMESPHPAIRQAASRFQGVDRTTQSIISVARTQTDFLNDPSISNVLGGHDFNIADFKTSVSTLYLIIPTRDMQAYARFLRLIVMSAFQQLSATIGGNRTLFILDEFPVLGRLPSVEEEFRVGRGHNIQLWPFVQSINDLEHIYGKQWESFISNAGVVQWFTPNDHGTTAEYLSKRVGKTTILSTSYSESETVSHTTGRGTNISFSAFHHGQNTGRSSNRSTGFSRALSRSTKDEGVDFLSPQDLIALPGYFQILTLAGLKYPILAFRERYYEWCSEGRTDWLRDCDPDPFHPNSRWPSPRPVGVSSMRKILNGFSYKIGKTPDCIGVNWQFTGHIGTRLSPSPKQPFQSIKSYFLTQWRWRRYNIVVGSFYFAVGIDNVVRFICIDDFPFSRIAKKTFAEDVPLAAVAAFKVIDGAITLLRSDNGPSVLITPPIIGEGSSTMVTELVALLNDTVTNATKALSTSSVTQMREGRLAGGSL